MLQFVLTNNLGRQNAYGIIGSDHAPGNDSIRSYLPASEISYNVIADGDASRYPPLNQFPTTAQFMAQFVGYNVGDYRQIPGVHGATPEATVTILERPLRRLAVIRPQAARECR